MNINAPLSGLFANKSTISTIIRSEIVQRMYIKEAAGKAERSDGAEIKDVRDKGCTQTEREEKREGGEERGRRREREEAIKQKKTKKLKRERGCIHIVCIKL